MKIETEVPLLLATGVSVTLWIIDCSPQMIIGTFVFMFSAARLAIILEERR